MKRKIDKQLSLGSYEINIRLTKHSGLVKDCLCLDSNKQEKIFSFGIDIWKERKSTRLFIIDNDGNRHFVNEVTPRMEIQGVKAEKITIGQDTYEEMIQNEN